MPISLRPDFDAARVRQAARASQDGSQVRRLLSLAAIYEGATRTRAAEIGGVTLQIVRDWVLKFNAHGPSGLIDRRAPGQPSRLNASHRSALAAIVEAGPDPVVHGVVRWRIIDLCRWVWDQFQISVSKQTLSRELRAMGFRKLSARPRHHAQAAGAIEEFKKSSQKNWMRSRANKVSRETPSKSGSPMKHASAKRTRSPAAGPGAAAGPRRQTISAPAQPTSSAPSAPEQETPPASSCPGATLTMNLHLATISAEIAPGKHAAVLADQAGWHLSTRLTVPPNITIVPLPAKCPELNGQENVWQYIRDNWLSNLIFDTCDDIIDHCCRAWNRFADRPELVRSVGSRDWAHGF